MFLQAEMRKHFNLSVRLFQNFDCGCGIFQDTLTSVVPLQTNLHPSKFYESVGGQASQHSADGYMHTSWHAVIYPVLPCSWHAISILNLNYPACFQHANLHSKLELPTLCFFGCRLQVMNWPLPADR